MLYMYMETLHTAAYIKKTKQQQTFNDGYMPASQ